MNDQLRSDEEMAKGRIGPPEILNSQIHLVPYDPEWPRLFEREAARIRAALGDQALLVEHCGSTAVPGLSAKPRIDIILAVVDTRAEAGLRRAARSCRVRAPHP